jgi:hypothetical protein
MSRSTQASGRVQAAAFDFDVVTDVPTRPMRKPEAAPDSASADPSVVERPKLDAAESR